MAERVRATFTNLEPGPRGVAAAAGLVMIEAGAEARVELDAGDLAAATATGWFAVATVDAPRRRQRNPR